MSVAAPSIEEELAAFERGTLDPALFPHREHVRFAYEMLARQSFGETLIRFSRGLEFFARKAGKPNLYHETITVAFLAVINEHRLTTNHSSWADFIAQNEDLLEKDALLRWYSKEQLQSALARKIFCLPAPQAGEAAFAPAFLL